MAFARWNINRTSAIRTVRHFRRRGCAQPIQLGRRPLKGNYLATLVSLLARLAGAPGQTKAIRIHFRDHNTRPSAEIIARDGSAQVKGLLPLGYRIEFYAWSEKPGGEDFHDRYVLTELGGIMIRAGLSADGPEESAAFTLLNFEHAQGLRSRFSDGSPV